MIGRLFKVHVRITDLYILASDGIANPAGILALLFLVSVLVCLELAVLCVLAEAVINFGVALALLAVELGHEFLDVGHAVAAGVVGARGHDVFGVVHAGQIWQSYSMVFIESCVKKKFALCPSLTSSAWRKDGSVVVMFNWCFVCWPAALHRVVEYIWTPTSAANKRNSIE